MSIHRLIPIFLLLAIVPVAAYTAVGTMHVNTQTHPSSTAPSVSVDSSVSISVSGNATRIGHSNETASQSHGHSHSHLGPQVVSTTASATIKGTVILSTNGTMRFNITGTSLTIGSTTYTVVNGSGIVNRHSMIVVLHATVMNGNTIGHLILIGRVTGTLPQEGSGSGMNVSFSSPQSKLASSFFLSLDGTLTLS